MLRRKSRPVRGAHMTVLEPRLLTDWEATHVFLEVARSGSFRAAAEKLRQSVNALRRKVDELEARMGFTLLVRRANGVALTEEGKKTYDAVLRMEEASFDVLKAQDSSAADAGEVVVAVTEGLGSFWLTSKLPDFQRANPNLTLNLNCAMQVANVARLEADIAIRLDRPKSSELKISKLGRLHAMFYAHRSYLEAYGTPTSTKDLGNHRLILQCDTVGKWVVTEPHFFPGGVLPKASVRPNAGSANGWAIIQGAGIGILPTYVEAICSDLVMLDLVSPYAFDVWITYHADAKKSPRVRKAIEWLTESFDPRRHPWFRDEFIHPRKFARAQKGGLAVMSRIPAPRQGRKD
jgi:DNA-binding transcriptional LysR family regulator